MLKLPLVLLFTAMTFISWGVYGILLHEGQSHMGNSSLRSFVGVGIAYFLIAVLGAGSILGSSNEKGHWSIFGSLLSILAGSVGALGALGVILALSFGGDPVYVMPLVFGGAPVINTLVTTWLSKTFDQIKPLFVIGMIFVGVGMIGVLMFKPRKEAVAKPVAVTVGDAISTVKATEGSGDSMTVVSAEILTVAAPDKAKSFNLLGITASIIGAIICWGSYGPFLHLGQMRMGGSRLRPFLCVGLAYFVIAVALPLMILAAQTDNGAYTFDGLAWSIAAGAAGAIGALGIIFAFNYGGKPVFVMPLIFGFAPVINTLVAMGIAGKLSQITTIFACSLGLVIGGAVMVLIFAPKPKHGPKPAPTIDPKNDSMKTVEIPAEKPSEKLSTSSPVDPKTEATPATSGVKADSAPA